MRFTRPHKTQETKIKLLAKVVTMQQQKKQESMFFLQWQKVASGRVGHRQSPGQVYPGQEPAEAPTGSAVAAARSPTEPHSREVILPGGHEANPDQIQSPEAGRPSPSDPGQASRSAMTKEERGTV